MTHREMARARRAAGAPAGRLSWPARGLALVGSVFVGFAYWGAFRGGDLHRLVGASLPPDARVAAASGVWSVAPAARGWVRVPAGRVGDENSDLELLGPDGESWLVGYVNASPASALDQTVVRRSQLLQAAGRFRDVWERRFFYPGLDLAPASLARYELAGWPRTVFQVLTVADEARTIEVIGYADATEAETRMRALLETVVIVPEAAP
jgi:hypothetical protein